MQNKKKLAVAMSTFGCACLLLAGGGTFAWYQFQDTASAGFNGTTIEANNSLKLGIYSPELTAAVAGETDPTGPFHTGMTTYHLTEDAVLDDVYWVANDLHPDVLSFVVESTGYTHDGIIAPVTSGEYSKNDTLSLKSEPKYLVNNTSAADHESYAQFALVFKTLDGDMSTALADQSIYFTGLSAVTTGGTVVAETMRLGIQSIDAMEGTVVKDILKPTAAAGGSHRVSGHADLNGDGVWDYTSNMKEMYYGEGTGTWASDASSTTFYPEPFSNEHFDGAEICNGTYVLTSTDKKANYSCLNDYKLGEIGADPFAVTGANGLAYVNFTIYMEGWDHACTNAVAEQQFNVNMAFQAYVN